MSFCQHLQSVSVVGLHGFLIHVRSNALSAGWSSYHTTTLIIRSRTLNWWTNVISLIPRKLEVAFIPWYFYFRHCFPECSLEESKAIMPSSYIGKMATILWLQPLWAHRDKIPPPWQQLLSDLSSSEDFEHVAWQDYEEDLEEMAQHHAQNMLFPRMYSSAHAQAYEDWMGGVEGTEIPYDRWI